MYRKQGGRASVTVGKGQKPGTVYVLSSCDSLQRLVESYELREQSRRAQTDSMAQASRQTTETTIKETKRAARPWLWCALTFIAGITAGIVVTLKIKKRK